MHKSEERAGGTQTRENRSPKIVCTSHGAASMLACCEGRGAIRNSLSMLHFARSHGAALCAARVGVRTAVDVAIGDSGA
jgi:hypothetical protein